MTVTDEQIAAAIEALRPIIPNSDGVLWEYEHAEDGQREPVTLAYAAQKALEAAARVSEEPG